MSLLESRDLRLVGSLQALRYTVAPCADADNAGDETHVVPGLASVQIGWLRLQ
jgi:hypothetical protein